MINKKVLAVVLTRNNYVDTKECIKSILLGTLCPFGIVIIDNGSQDGSIERLKADFANNPSVYFILNSKNFGFAAGVNIGIRFALEREADYVFLLNNDAVVDVECIENMCIAMEEFPDVGVVGPRIFYYRDPEKIWHGGGYFSRIKTGVVIPEKGEFADKCYEKSRQVTFLTGCAMLVKREVFEKIGLFDEDYFLYEEDLDFCLRASRAGFKLLYVPSAKVWHKIGTISKSRTSPFVLYNMARSHIIFLRKNFSWSYFLYGLLIHFALYTPFRLLQVIQGSQPLKNMQAWLHGSWIGFREALRGSKRRSFV